MNKPPLHIVGAGNRPLSIGKPSVQQQDSLNNAEFRIRFLQEMLSAVDPALVSFSADALAGFCLVLGDVDRELALAKNIC